MHNDLNAELDDLLFQSDGHELFWKVWKLASYAQQAARSLPVWQSAFILKLSSFSYKPLYFSSLNQSTFSNSKTIVFGEASPSIFTRSYSE